MNRILSIYSTKAYKAYLLPAINNSDHSIIINKEIFCLDSDIEIEMEIIDEKWHFLPSENYELVSVLDHNYYYGVDLKDNDLLSLILPNGENLSIMYDESDMTFGVYTKYDLLGASRVTIGKEENCNITYDNRKLISRDHASIVNQGNQWIIEDHSANGIFVNSRRVIGSKQLQFGDVVSIFGLTLVYLDTILAVSTNVEGVDVSSISLQQHVKEMHIPTDIDNKYVKGKNVFHRSPRPIFKIDDDTIEIEDPPKPKELNRRPIGMIIGPSMTMALPMLLGCGMAILSSKMSGNNRSTFMYTGLITAVSSAVIGTIWAITNLIFEKKRNREDELHRFEAYSEYLIKCANNIKGKYEKNYSNMNTMYVSAEECCKNDSSSAALWNRNVSHQDFMTHRLGIGDVPFQVNIIVPKERFSMINDSLSEKPAMIKESYSVLHDVPICVDMIANRMIGIVSNDGKKGTTDIMHNLVAQIASSNCYTDVKMAFVFDEAEDDIADWEYLKWLPHVWSEDKRNRYYSSTRQDAADVLYEITRVLRTRAENRSASISSNKGRLSCPQYILFLSNPKFIEGELIQKYLTDENNVDITTVILCDGFENLPNSCEFVIQNDAEFSGMYATDTDVQSREEIRFDYISNQQLEKLARTLSNIEVSELETGGDIPSSLTFFDMYGVHRLEELNVLEKWKKNRTYDSMKALIGQRAGGTPWYLDIHEKYHGPHGLIAGTTGSGKSETLQTYILSLALNFSPDDVGFFIIDYKGGGMANLFNGMPHMIGQISNLSGNQVRRAMVSIKSENKRRQRIFNEHGVNNINLYTRLYKNNEASIPVPHMFIIIDEFAELKREEPDFMRELISVAQVGRSLGVHLILATQKPSGTVDDNIWSNSKFRLCLRVQDRQDSNDMLHRTDAAYITQAGRCYMQVGNDELFELFQSGYSGATYDEELGSTKLEIVRMVSENGKAALVGNRLKLKQKENSKRKWIRCLIAAIEIAYSEDDDMAIFNYFDRCGIEYPYSDYALARIRDLVKCIQIVKSSNPSLAEDLLIDAVIMYADLNKVKLPEKKEKTQLDAVVEYLAKIAKENGYVHNLQLWLPVLPTCIALDALNGYRKEDYFDGSQWTKMPSEWTLEIPIGMYDDPVNQSQDTFSLNLARDGHHAIIGTVVTGKSTFVQSMMYGLVTRYSPECVNIYALDYSAKMATAFEKMPHVGGVILENDTDKVDKFFNMLGTILNERKELFKGGNYAQYVRTNGISVPAIVVFIDNYANFKGKTNNKYESMIMQLVKDGVGYGIFMVVTAGGFNAAEMPARIGENFRTVVCLELPDKFQYADALHTMRIETLPENNVKGRGLARIGESLLEFQTALCINETDDFKRMELIETMAISMKEVWKGKNARQIPTIPEKPIWSEFVVLDEAINVSKDNRHLPIGYNSINASIYSIDLSQHYCYLIGGKGRTGKTNLLKVIANSIVLKGYKPTIIDYSGELKQFAELGEFRYVDSDAQLRQFLKDIQPGFLERNRKKKELKNSGIGEEEIFEAIQEFEPWFIIISNLADFVEHVNRPKDTSESMKGFVDNLLDRGALHNVYWFAAHNYEEGNRVVGNSVYDFFVRSKKGMHLGGNVSSQRVFNFDYVPYMEQSKALKAGVGMPAGTEDEVVKVVLPIAK